MAGDVKVGATLAIAGSIAAMFIGVSASVALSQRAESQRDAKIATACIEAGGEWLTRSVVGHPDNHECVRS